MFTINQIKEAHSKVKSGADFPKYIKEIKLLGVTSYETFVSHGCTNYFGINGYYVSSNGRYDNLSISSNINAEQFKTDLKAHQQGKSDFPTFCKDCAKSGIEKWVVSLDKMTCAYFDKSGKAILAENIPQ